MNNKRRNTAIGLTVLSVVVAVGAIFIIQLKQAIVKDNRVVQILESKDGRLKAELIRRHGFFDLNFIIQLNGEQIYVSPDFKPNYTIPFRETILWDKTGENLIFEVNGERLFGYNWRAKRKLLDRELLAVQVQELKYEDFGCFGCWPSLQSD